MPRYMIVFRRDPQFVSRHVNLVCKICAKEKRAIWKEANFNLKEGLIFCEWDAPDQDTLKEVLMESGLPLGEIVEVEKMKPEECDWRIFGELGE